MSFYTPGVGGASFHGASPRASAGVRIATFIVVILPVLGLAAAVALLWGVAFDWVHLVLLGAMYVVTGVGIGVGYHRLYTHKSFDTGRAMALVWGVLGSMAVEGPLIKWVAVHRKHHQHSDDAADPHSPHAGCGTDGHPGLLRGLWRSHVGWLFEKDAPDLARYVPDLQKDPVARFVDRTFLLWVGVGLLLPAMLGGLIAGSWTGALLGFLWGGLVRVLVVHHITWCINSVCHIWGAQPFESRDESRDNPVFGVLAFGEGWHNSHHAFPTSARHGLRWWQFDFNYLVIRAMESLRLARNVRVPSAERVAARRRSRALEPRRPH